MKLGFLTNTLAWEGLKDIKEIAAWGIENGFDDLEVGPALPLDEKLIAEIKQEGKIDITSLIYCRNFMDENKEVAQQHKTELIKRINVAGRLGIEKVICSTGVVKEAFRGIRFNLKKVLMHPWNS